MARRIEPAAPPQPRLSKDVIVEACIRLADRVGSDAVTLRGLGAELGVDATAIYRYFRNKDELLTATADHLFTDAIEGVPLTGTFNDLRAIGLALRGAYMAHPQVALLFLRATAPLTGEAAIVEATLAGIRGLGFSERDAAMVFEVLESYTLAVSCMDGIGASIPQGTFRRIYAALPPAEFPNLSASAQWLYEDADARFEFGLELIMESIRARSRSGRGTGT